VDADGAVLSLGFQAAREGNGSVDGPRLLANLERLVREAQAYGVVPVLMTYPTDGQLYRFTNKLIRQAALRTGARLVDLTPVFTAQCPDPECAELLFEDRHPRALGYALIAQTLSENIGDLLDP
jgi:lysophospholipase L1-like esterase